MATQLEHTVELNSVDVSAEVYEFKIIEKRATTRRRPTAANANESVKAGAASAEVRIQFEDTLDPTTSLAHQELADALRTDSGEVTFLVRYKSGAVGVTNPEYTGTLVVTELETGGEVGDELDQQQTFTVTQAGITIATV